MGLLFGDVEGDLFAGLPDVGFVEGFVFLAGQLDEGFEGLRGGMRTC
jgi:hypothetical protein